MKDASEPLPELPTNRVVLEDLYRLCRDNLEYAQRLQHRDEARGQLIRAWWAGKISGEEFDRRRADQLATHWAESDVSAPEDRRLLPYVDADSYLAAINEFNKGLELVKRGYELAEDRPPSILEVAEGFEMMSVAQAFRVQVLEALLEDIHDQLSFIDGTAVQPEAASGHNELPKWNRSSGKLTFRGQVIRSISRPNVAANICSILDSFERSSWPETIEIPKFWLQKTMHDAVTSLNKNTRLICFFGRWTEKSIGWQIADDIASE